MREIKFRGKDLEGKWHYGDLVHLGEGCIIIEESKLGEPIEHEESEFALGYHEDEFAVVVPDTIGQFTSLKDKNGKEIYEGDIVVYDNILHDNMVCICKFDESTSSFMLIENTLPFGDSHYIHRSETRNMEVIGNIYDTKL